MAVTSVTNPYVRYPTLSDAGVASLINGASPASQKNDNLFNNTKLLTYISRSQIKAQQTAYRQQVKDFSSSTHALSNSASAMSHLPANQDTAKTLQDVRKTLDGYNRLATELSEADNLSSQGKAVFSGLKAVMEGREKDLNAIGITQSSTGEWSVDEAKFTKAATEDRPKVQSVLGGSRGLGAVVSAAVATTVSQPVADFIKSPGQTVNRGYGTTGNNTNTRSAPYGRGIFLDLMA